MIIGFGNNAIELYKNNNTNVDTSLPKTKWNGDLSVTSDFLSTWADTFVFDYNRNKIFVESDVVNALNSLPHIVDLVLNKKSKKEDYAFADLACSLMCKPQGKKFIVSKSIFTDGKVPHAIDNIDYVSIRLQFLGVDALRRLYTKYPDELDKKYQEIFFDKNNFYDNDTGNKEHVYGRYARLRIVEHIHQHGITSEIQKNIVLAALKEDGYIHTAAFKVAVDVIKNVQENYPKYTSPIPFLEHFASEITAPKDKTDICQSTKKLLDIGVLKDFKDNLSSIKDTSVLNAFNDIDSKVTAYIENLQRIKDEKKARVQKYGKILGKISFLPV